MGIGLRKPGGLFAGDGRLIPLICGMQRDASYYYELIAQAAARGEEAPEDLINGLTLAHLEHLKTFIGQSELQLPEGFLVGVDPRSIEWANASTAYRERYERQVYLAATYLGGEGFTF